MGVIILGNYVCCQKGLGRDAGNSVKEFWGEIGPVLPDQGVYFWIEPEFFELADILQGCKNNPFQLVFQVYVAFQAIVEFKADDVIPEISCLGDLIRHHLLQWKSMGFYKVFSFHVRLRGLVSYRGSAPRLVGIRRTLCRSRVVLPRIPQ